MPRALVTPIEGGCCGAARASGFCQATHTKKKTHKGRELDATACSCGLIVALRRAAALNWVTKAIALLCGRVQVRCAPLGPSHDVELACLPSGAPPGRPHAITRPSSNGVACAGRSSPGATLKRNPL